MREVEAPPLHVTLLRHGDVIVVDLAEKGTLVPRSEVRVDDAFLRDLASEMEAVVVQRGSGTEQALARVGGLVFSHLLSEPARRRLGEAAPSDLYLRLDERLVHVPWELCHDGERFLFERFRVGRQVITGHAIPVASRSRVAPNERLRILVVADPTEDLPQASVEGERLCSLLDEVPGVEVTLLSGRSVRRIPLLSALQQHDAVHFAGHSHFDAATPARSGWQLADGVLTADEIAKLRPAPFLVFSNSCEAGASSAWQSGQGYDGHAFGIGSAFLLAGVPSYVGTFWVVHDGESVAFATAYYAALAAGARLGDALDAARREVIASFGSGALAWASYVLYGDPALQPLAGADEQGRARGTRPSSAAREEIRFEVSLTDGGERPAHVDRMPEMHVVGREAELAVLDEALAASRGGDRRVVLVSGPPGIGKTTLLDAFLGRTGKGGDVAVAQGQAVEHYGAGEAYLPLLEALGRLGAFGDARLLVDELRRHAPTWLAQLPALVEPAEHEALARRTQGSTRERMLRELADALEAVTARRPLVLVLEDLHWSDHSTIEAIAYVAQRRAPARLLIVVTYRPAEVATGEHPLRSVAQELEARRRGVTLRLDVLDEQHVGQYLLARLGGDSVDPRLARILHRRTEGHPLFLVNVVDFALRSGLIVRSAGNVQLGGDEQALASSIPHGLLPMIERQIEALTTDEQQVLEAAAVAGAEFSIAAVASGLGVEADQVDDHCERLAWRGQFVRAAGMEEWPDGTLAGRYRFVHALYQNVLYERVAEARRVRLHRRIAERKALAYGVQAADIAGELAAHFTAARDPRRALGHRVRAGDLAGQRHADREAVEHYRESLRLLASVGNEADRNVEVDVLVKLATRLMSIAGYGAREVEQVFDRAYALSRQLAVGPYHAPLLRGMVSFHHVRARNDLAVAVSRELLAVCEKSNDRIAQVQAHYGIGAALYDLGALDDSRHHLEAALEGYDPATHVTHVAVYGGYDPGVACRCWLAWVHWLRGEPDTALRLAEDGLVLAEELGHPFTLGFANMALASICLYRGDLAQLARPLARANTIAVEDGFPYLRATVAGLNSWSELTRGRIEAAITSGEESLAAHESTGARLTLPAFYLVLGYAKALAGQTFDGLELIESALLEAERSQPLHLAPLYRARGELLLVLGGASRAAEAEECHLRGLRVAREIGSRTLELQAAMGYCRYLQGSGRGAEGRALVEPLYAGFSEGSDISLLRDARALLEAD